MGNIDKLLNAVLNHFAVFYKSLRVYSASDRNEYHRQKTVSGDQSAAGAQG
jgi:hypothetical protein